MNLYPIQQQHLSILSIVEDNEGEVTEEIEQALQLTQDQFQMQAVSVGYVFKHLEDREAIIKKEIDRLKSLCERTASAKENVKDRLKEAMELFGITEIKGETLKLSFRASESVEVDENYLPDEYKVVKTTTAPDKAKIKADIKEGVNVPGATLIKKQNLQIK